MKLSSEHIAVLQRAIRVLGPDSQIYKTVEEMAELTKELLKRTTWGKDNMDQVKDEIADVHIMLASLGIIYDLDESEISALADAKIKRLDDRLDAREGKKG